MLFSGKDLRKLIIPLMFEQLLAVLVGLSGYTYGIPVRRSGSCRSCTC